VLSISRRSSRRRKSCARGTLGGRTRLKIFPASLGGAAVHQSIESAAAEHSDDSDRRGWTNGPSGDFFPCRRICGRRGAGRSSISSGLKAKDYAGMTEVAKRFYYGAAVGARRVNVFELGSLIISFIGREPTHHRPLTTGFRKLNPCVRNLIPFAENSPAALRARETMPTRATAGGWWWIGGVAREMAGSAVPGGRGRLAVPGAGLVLVGVPKGIWDVCRDKTRRKRQTRGRRVRTSDDTFHRVVYAGTAEKSATGPTWSVMGPGMSQKTPGRSRPFTEIVEKMAEAGRWCWYADAAQCLRRRTGRTLVRVRKEKKNTRREIVLDAASRRNGRGLLNTSGRLAFNPTARQAGAGVLRSDVRR